MTDVTNLKCKGKQKINLVEFLIAVAIIYTVFVKKSGVISEK